MKYNILYEQNEGHFKVKARGAYNYYCALQN